MSSHKVADADEGVSVPGENFSPCSWCLRERPCAEGFDDKLWTTIYTVREDRARIISVTRARENEEAITNDSTRI